MNDRKEWPREDLRIVDNAAIYLGAHLLMDVDGGFEETWIAR